MKAYFLWLAKLITTLVVIMFSIFFFVGGIVGALSMEKNVVSTAPVVAVVDLEGPIMDAREVIRTLDEQTKSDKVKAVVLRINSPGGVVGPSQEIFYAVERYKKRKPIVASMGAVAASGGLYAALSASKIYAQPGTLTGSIGVIMQAPNVSALADKVGFQMLTVKSGALKDAGNPFRPVTEQDSAYLQETVMENYLQFKTAVATARNIPMEKVETFADGRILLGSKALELGVIDALGDEFEAARAAAILAGVTLADDEYPKLHYVDEKYKEFRQLLKGAAQVISPFVHHIQASYILQ